MKVLLLAAVWGVLSWTACIWSVLLDMNWLIVLSKVVIVEASDRIENALSDWSAWWSTVAANDVFKSKFSSGGCSSSSSSSCSISSSLYVLSSASLSLLAYPIGFSPYSYLHCQRPTNVGWRDRFWRNDRWETYRCLWNNGWYVRCCKSYL